MEWSRRQVRWMPILLLLLLVGGLLPLLWQREALAVANLAPEAEPPAPEGQTYIGVKRCSACHFDQFMQWKKTKHAAAFDILTAKYQGDAKCLKCHTTGLGEPSGFKSVAATPALVAVSCENCHGPGSKHEEVSKPFANVKQLTAEQEKVVRDSIWKMLPQNVCVTCHNTQAHKESQTPPELRKK